MNGTVFYAAAFRVAEQAHNGASDEYLKSMCLESADLDEQLAKDLYDESRKIYNKEFA